MEIESSVSADGTYVQGKSKFWLVGGRNPPPKVDKTKQVPDEPDFSPPNQPESRKTSIIQPQKETMDVSPSSGATAPAPQTESRVRRASDTPNSGDSIAQIQSSRKHRRDDSSLIAVTPSSISPSKTPTSASEKRRKVKSQSPLPASASAPNTTSTPAPATSNTTSIPGPNTTPATTTTPVIATTTTTAASSTVRPISPVSAEVPTPEENKPPSRPRKSLSEANGNVEPMNGFQQQHVQLDQKALVKRRETELVDGSNTRVQPVNTSAETFVSAFSKARGSESILATGSVDGNLKLWSLDSLGFVNPRPVAICSHVDTVGENKEIITLDWNPSGSVVATGTFNGISRLWASDGSLLHTLSNVQGPVVSIRWSPSGSLVASASADQSVAIWSSKTGALIYMYQGTSLCTDVVWIDDRTLAIGGAQGSVECLLIPQTYDAFEARPELRLERWDGHDAGINTIQWDETSGFLMSAADDGLIKLWRYGNKIAVSAIRGHEAEVTGACWETIRNFYSLQSDGKPIRRFASCSLDGTVRIWSVRNDGSWFQNSVLGRDLFSLGLLTVQFSNDGLRLAAGGKDGILGVWTFDCPTLEPKRVHMLSSVNSSIGVGGNSLSEIQLRSHFSQEAGSVDEESAGVVVDISWSSSSDKLAVCRMQQKVNKTIIWVYNFF